MRGNNGHPGIAPLYQGKALSDEQERLRILVSERGSLLAVSEKTGLNVGYLSAIWHGQRPASKRARRLLGLKKRRPTFDERAAQYDAWLARNAARIAAIVAWAEGGKR